MTKLNENLIKQKLVPFIGKELHIDKSEFDDSSELNLIGADSLTLVKILLFIEKEFKVSIPDEDLTKSNFKNIKSITKRILNYEK
jgi:acyl carrier protein